jgi:hypothetical protein
LRKNNPAKVTADRPKLKVRNKLDTTHASHNAWAILEQAERVSTFKLPIP